MLGAISPFHASQPLLIGDDLASRASGHVTVGERHRRGRGLIRELGQLGSQPPQLGLTPRAGVLGDQASQPFMAEGAKVAGAVECMKAGLHECGPGT
jgi:hypothetical protein